MPTYVWECPVCRVPMELTVPMSEAYRPLLCTGPHKASLLCKRVITAPMVIIKNPAAGHRKGK